MRHLLRIILLLLGFVAVVVIVAKLGNPELLLVVLSLAVVLPVLYLVIDRFEQRHHVLRLREEGLRAEVASLKAQIDPHFFFNTLNNLYGLTVARDERAPALILKLSDLMRFTIYEGRKDHVPLRDELQYLDNYLEIQRLRLRQGSVELRFERSVADDLLVVPPLMLIVLIENAIKHGVATLTEGAFVHLELETGDNWLRFSARNNHGLSEPGFRRPRPAGIGIANLERRLALLFPQRHEFTHRDHDGVFTATLRLDL